MIPGPMPAAAANTPKLVSATLMASAAAAIKVADTNFGVFAAAAGMGPGIIQNYAAPGQLPLNSRSSTAKPGQVAILLGTGLGAIAGLDSPTPPVGDLPAGVRVTVGGKPATKLYSGRMPGVAGVDQINFQVPADAPSGCYVPVQ